MRLGYLVPEFPNLTHAFFYREIKALEASGVDVRVYSTRRPALTDCPHAFAAEMRARTNYVFPASAAAAAWLARRPARTAAAVRYVMGLDETPPTERARLMGLLPSAAMLAMDAGRHGLRHLHIHSCAHAAHLGALVNILSDLSYSLSLHGDLPVYGVDHAAKMKRASFVAAVTQPLADQINEASPGTRAPVVWMGVDTNRFAPPARPHRKNPDAPFEVATIARLNHTKGHRFFLEAMAILRQRGIAVRYRMAGEGPDQAQIDDDIARLGLGAQVEYLGPLGEQGVLDLLHRVDAVALTSFGQGEAAPVTIMEAMASSVPVVCSIIGGTPDMITDGHDGLLVPQRDPVAIADAVERLAANPDLADRIGRAARVTALEQFDSAANAAKLLLEIEKR